jgi:putative membrane protein
MRTGLFLRGVAMGLAEAVPGVSGGTIAFVTGIYDELIDTLSRIDWRCFRVLSEQGIAGLWRYVNGNFLLVLGLGMVLAIGVFANFMSWALEQHAPLVWGFFFGLIVFSIVQIGRGLPARMLALGVPVGILLGLGAAMLPTGGSESSLPWFFLGGAIAVSAWMLPAVSGSFMLLVLGLYEPVIEAVSTLHWPILVTLAAGCGVGLLLFAKVMRWAMTEIRVPLLAVLTGFMAGALPRLWPWQDGQALFLPAEYAVATGSAGQLPLVILAMVTGGVLLWLLTRLQP